jgi:sulfate adenylyltransferase
VNAAIRMQTYEALIPRARSATATATRRSGAAQGSVPDRVLLLGLDIKMFYGGPKEAVMHSIYRQNYGFTDIVIGRKHADAPYHDGSAIWGDFDAQEIFDRLQGDLKIKPLKVGFAAYYEYVGRVDLMACIPTRSPCSSRARTCARRCSRAARSIRASCDRARRAFSPPPMKQA